MTPQEVQIGLGRLKAAYPATKFDDFNVAAYSEVLAGFNNADFTAAWKVLVTTAEFFPSLAKIAYAVDDACRKRLAQKDHDEREERLAIKAADEAIMDPNSEVHRVVVGPKHQEFLDYLSGKKTFPEPEWMNRKGKKSTRSWAEGEAYPSMMPYDERASRIQLLKQQASMLIAEDAK